jgi:CYTH domain-containing protein
MPQEIERKFLVKGDGWRVAGTGIPYRQGYLSTVPERTVRVRLIRDKGYLTIKGVTVGATRAEYEYEIPAGEASEMLDNLCERPLIEKTRYRVELEDEDQTVIVPDWVGKEVTGERRYYNASLIAEPYTSW